MRVFNLGRWQQLFSKFDCIKWKFTTAMKQFILFHTLETPDTSDFFFNQYRWHKISHHYFYFHSFNEKLNIIPYFIIFEMLFEFLMWFLVSLFYILICKKVWYILGTNSICPISLLSLSLLFTFFIVTFKNNNKLNSICILTYRKTEISNSWFNATQPVINIAYSNISSFNVDITLKTTKNTASLVLTIILFFA